VTHNLTRHIQIIIVDCISVLPATTRCFPLPLPFKFKGMASQRGVLTVVQRNFVRSSGLEDISVYKNNRRRRRGISSVISFLVLFAWRWQHVVSGSKMLQHPQKHYCSHPHKITVNTITCSKSISLKKLSSVVPYGNVLRLTYGISSSLNLSPSSKWNACRVLTTYHLFRKHSLRRASLVTWTISRTILQ
jgi:hypothetical protein